MVSVQSPEMALLVLVAAELVRAVPVPELEAMGRDRAHIASVVPEVAVRRNPSMVASFHCLHPGVLSVSAIRSVIPHSV